MWRWVPACTLFLLVPCTAAAQGSRDEAIRLLVAGDYQRAAQALRPLAEDSTNGDPAAQFLLALLYDTGQGVPRNVMGACGLYRAAAAGGPFRQTAGELGRMLHEDSPIPERLCSVGPWHDRPAASFTLGPNHSVQYSSNTIVVRYQDAERRIVTGDLPGTVPLPVRYTPLDVTHPFRERRHFVQSFSWVPDNPASPASWTLTWGVVEIVGVELVHGAVERNVLMVAGAQRPTTTDVASLVRVYVNSSGEAEWTVTSGPNARSGILPRREQR
jgi:hypothetical protein